MNVMSDPSSGLLIPQPVVPIGLGRPKVKGYGAITYRCHTCGELIVKPWETFFVDPEPATAWASNLMPADTATHPRMTTHHDWHIASQQRED